MWFAAVLGIRRGGGGGGGVLSITELSLMDV